MRSPKRCRAAAVWLATGVIATSCASRSGAADPDRSPPAEATAAPQNGTRDTAGEPSNTDHAAAALPPTTTVVEDPSPASVAVTGGELPTELVDGYARNGGDLVDPSEWQNRFGRTPLPELTGPGARLVEALRRTDRRDGRWIRSDEAGWLAMSRDDRDTMMSSLRDAADLDGEASRTTSNEQGADCVIDAYPADRTGVSWQVQGCSYDTFPGLLSLGISRSGPTEDPPPTVDPTIAAVADALDGSVTFVEVRFGKPAPDGSTLRLSAQLSTAHRVDPTALVAAGGPLAGWQTFPGDGSVLLSGPTGATWTLSDGVAVFTWAGRW